MRFPSFIKVPNNRRFELIPRHYDPIKEEIEERTSRIKREMSGDEGEFASDFTPGKKLFERKSPTAPSSSLLQLLIAAILGLTFVGWLYFGNQIFYSLWLVVPFYLFFRLKKGMSRKR